MPDSSPKPAPGDPTKSTVVHVKETLESIVVAFILAFIFRAFIVEAFVIPTGSMATTLYGKQLTQTCSNCGYEYALGIPAGADGSVRLQCPNCGAKTDEFKRLQITRPDSGDRILVHKWPLDMPGEWLGPQRWDVTVFKDPRDGTTNFIKRLVGLPGEVLEIMDGDVYTVSVEDLEKKKPQLLDELDRLRQEVYRFRADPSESRQQELIQQYRRINGDLLPILRIQRKTPRAQASLWSNVYNHDFLPNESKRDVGWQPDDAGAWDTSTRTITFTPRDHQQRYMRFYGKPIDDFCAYNKDKLERRPVGDLRLRLDWMPRSGNGTLMLDMNRNRDRFIASLAVDGTIQLERERLDESGHWKRQWALPSRQRVPFVAGETVRIEFVNVDYRVSLVVDDREVIATTDDEYKPRPEDLQQFCDAVARERDPNELLQPSTVRIGAQDIACELLHVALERDVYYRCQAQAEAYATSQDEDQLTPQIHRDQPNPYHKWPGWATAGQPILLRRARDEGDARHQAEFFMLGDNSPASKDSRLWWEIGPHLLRLGEEYQVGTVPQDQLIGKAFFVYWPAGYRAAWAGDIGLIPNFGRMRWIR